MALRFMDSFDHYATGDLAEKWTSNAGGHTISAGTGRRGTAGLKGGGGLFKTLDNQATWIIGFAFRPKGAFSGPSTIIRLRDTGVAQIDLSLNTNGTLSILRAGSVALTGGSSTLSLSIDVYYYIEWKVTIADSIAASSCVVRVDGVDWITVATGQDTQQTTNAFANELAIVNGPTQAADFDDLYVLDGTGSAPHNNFLGDCRVDALLPNGDGSNSAWTLSTGSTHSTLVDETAPNDDTDYITTSTAAARDSHNFANTPTMTSPTVYGIQHCISARKDDAGTRQIKSLLKSGATTVTGGTTYALASTYTYYQQIYAQDPNTAAAWTTTAIDALEAGVENQ